MIYCQTKEQAIELFKSRKERFYWISSKAFLKRYCNMWNVIQVYSLELKYPEENISPIHTIGSDASFPWRDILPAYFVPIEEPKEPQKT